METLKPQVLGIDKLNIAEQREERRVSDDQGSNKTN